MTFVPVLKSIYCGILGSIIEFIPAIETITFLPDSSPVSDESNEIMPEHAESGKVRTADTRQEFLISGNKIRF